MNYVRAETTSSSKPPFREGIEYRYEWEASIESESSVSDQMATSTWLRGQLYIISKVEGSKWRSLLRVYILLFKLSFDYDKLERYNWAIQSID